MLEIESQTVKIYSLSQRHIEMFDEGRFTYNPDDSNTPEEIVIKSLYVEPTGDEYTVPEARIHIKYYPKNTKHEVEYILDPNDLSKIRINEKPRRGFLGRTIKPRMEANSKDLALLYNILDWVEPKSDFRQKLQSGRRKIEQEGEEMSKINKEIEKAIERRKREAHLEDRARKKAIAILGSNTPDTQCLGIVVDDYSPKFDGKHGLLSSYKDANIDCNISFHLLIESGEAIKIITYIQQLLSESENKLPVIVFMDGSMPDCEYKSGIKTVQALKARLNKAGLPMPYLVGNSNDELKNKMLKSENESCYITSLDYDEAGWSAIKDVIRK